MSRSSALAILAIAAACAHPAPNTPTPSGASPTVTPTRPTSLGPTSPALMRDTNRALPPIPLVEGPLAIHVVFPAENAPPANRDSNYMLGSVGNGRATLTINGHPATVYPNGSFMAFIPQPPITAPRFDLVAVLGTDTVRATHMLRLPVERVPLPLEGRVIVDSSEFAPRSSSNLFLRDDERTTVSL